MPEEKKMIPTTIYLLPAVKRQIKQLAREQQCRESELLRNALDEGLRHLATQGASSTHGLLKLAKSAAESGPGPTDLAANHDKYLWDA